MTVVRVEDLGVVPLPPGTGDYTPGRVAPRRGLKPIEIRQPAGVSFTGRRLGGALAELALPARLQRA